MDVKTASSATFDDKAALAAIKASLEQRKEKAAAYALTELLKRIPVGDPRNGHMKDHAGVELSENGFEVYIRKYYAYFIEKGWHAGARRTSEARAARKLAKDIRAFRKATGGGENLKKLESELRRRAKQLNETNAAKRTWIDGRFILRDSVKDALPHVIEILAGRA